MCNTHRNSKLSLKMIQVSEYRLGQYICEMEKQMLSDDGDIARRINLE